jgi:hypothetical protein
MYCIETDDDMDPFTAGETSSMFFEHTDECIVEDGVEYVLEGVCSGGSWVAQIECEFGCSEGACQPEPEPEPEPEPVSYEPLSCEDIVFVSAIGPTELQAGAPMPDFIETMVTYLGDAVVADGEIDIFLSEDLVIDEADFELNPGPLGMNQWALGEVSSGAFDVPVADMQSVPEEFANSTSFVLVRATLRTVMGADGSVVIDDEGATCDVDFFVVEVSGPEAE